VRVVGLGDDADVDFGRLVLGLQVALLGWRRGVRAPLHRIVFLRLAVLGLLRLVHPGRLDHIDLPELGVLVFGACVEFFFVVKWK